MGFVKRIEIRWRDLDGFAHVNNSVYFTYGEEVRDEYFTDLLGHDVVNCMVVRHCEIDYRSGLTQADDYADVHVEITAVGRTSVTTAERIVSVADGRRRGRVDHRHRPHQRRANRRRSLGRRQPRQAEG